MDVVRITPTRRIETSSDYEGGANAMFEAAVRTNALSMSLPAPINNQGAVPEARNSSDSSLTRLVNGLMLGLDLNDWSSMNTRSNGEEQVNTNAVSDVEAYQDPVPNEEQPQINSNAVSVKEVYQVQVPEEEQGQVELNAVSVVEVYQSPVPEEERNRVNINTKSAGEVYQVPVPEEEHSQVNTNAASVGEVYQGILNTVNDEEVYHGTASGEKHGQAGANAVSDGEVYQVPVPDEEQSNLNASSVGDIYQKHRTNEVLNTNGGGEVYQEFLPGGQEVDLNITSPGNIQTPTRRRLVFGANLTPEIAHLRATPGSTLRKRGFTVSGGEIFNSHSNKKLKLPCENVQKSKITVLGVKQIAHDGAKSSTIDTLMEAGASGVTMTAPKKKTHQRGRKAKSITLIQGQRKISDMLGLPSGSSPSRMNSKIEKGGTNQGVGVGKVDHEEYHDHTQEGKA